MSYKKELAIELIDVEKKYMIYKNPADRLMDVLFKTKKRGREFTALSGATFAVNRGESVGIIGRNGAGKSTMLQLVCKTLEPTSGSIFTHGKIAALLELGSGFNFEFSGRENVYLAGAIAGMQRSQIEKKFDAIVAFAEIEKFIDQPVKNYSSGMMVRLAFAVATSIEPEILIIDEALSVGDGAFAKKSFDKIMELRERGATLLFCSHNLYQVKTLCDRAIWIKDGEIAFDGDSVECVDIYQAFLDGLDKKGQKELYAELQEEEIKQADNPSLGKLRDILVGITGRDSDGAVECECEKDSLYAEIAYNIKGDANDFSLAWLLTDANLRNISSASTSSDGVILHVDKNGDGKIRLTLNDVPVMRGEYILHVFLMSADDLFYYDSAVNAAHIKMVDKTHLIGVVKLPRVWENIDV